MLQYLIIPLVFALTSAISVHHKSQLHHVVNSYPTGQVASESQVKFALENKFDDTGPGANRPTYAYNTYKNVEDALVAYLDDPDTKLPEEERAKAINKLTQRYHNTPEGGRLIHKNANIKVFEKPQFRFINQKPEAYNFNSGKIYFSDDFTRGLNVPKSSKVNDMLGHYQSEKKQEPLMFPVVRPIKGSPLSLAHYTRDHKPQQLHSQFDPHPKYTFSYGVHDEATGDIKSAQESRDGGTVHGFYSYIDADGSTRTVHYTADDLKGFRANIVNTV